MIQDIFDFYQSNFGIISPSKSEQLRELTEENPKELVLEALKSADNYNAKSPIDYASSILNQWARKNIKSLEDVETERALRSKKIK
ncbi:DnaD domain-containing protein [Lactococcus fujiensis]|uniref:DnaD domain-containing protein n=1 Tax=Lactococcus fujiensis TaxID=610251 RepID=UPI0006D28D73|nr:DnaD domain protein [Lactococcus fujiensis]